MSGPMSDAAMRHLELTPTRPPTRDDSLRARKIVVDLRAAFREYWKKNNPENKPKGFLTYDGNHWTETGHAFVAEQMLKKLK